MTQLEEKWWGAHLIDIKGRCGLVLKEEIRDDDGISVVTPGKRESKNKGTEDGSCESFSK